MSKTSVDAENGHSLGGIISLNMKSGTNEFKGSAYVVLPRPEHERARRPDDRGHAGPGHQGAARHEAQDAGRHARLPDQEEQAVQLHLLRAVGRQAADHASSARCRRRLERAGDFSQSTLSGRVRTIYNPFSSVVDPATGRVVRTPFAGNVIPSIDVRPRRAEDAAGDAAAEPAGQRRQPGRYSVYEQDRLLELLRSAWTVNITDNWKMFVRYGQFKANLYQQNPTDAGFFPLSGSNRYGMSVAADSVWVMSNKHDPQRARQLLQHDRRVLQPVARCSARTASQNYWPNNPGTRRSTTAATCTTRRST